MADEKFLETNNDLARQFGAVSFFPEAFRGLWIHEGKRYEDENVRLFGDVEDPPANAAFFREFKAKLNERFRQLDIWLVSYEIRID